MAHKTQKLPPLSWQEVERRLNKKPAKLAQEFGKRKIEIPGIQEAKQLIEKGGDAFIQNLPDEIKVPFKRGYLVWNIPAEEYLRLDYFWGRLPDALFALGNYPRDYRRWFVVNVYESIREGRKEHLLLFKYVNDPVAYRSVLKKMIMEQYRDWGDKYSYGADKEKIAQYAKISKAVFQASADPIATLYHRFAGSYVNLAALYGAWAAYYGMVEAAKEVPVGKEPKRRPLIKDIDKIVVPERCRFWECTQEIVSGVNNIGAPHHLIVSSDERELYRDIYGPFPDNFLRERTFEDPDFRKLVSHTKNKVDALIEYQSTKSLESSIA